MIMLRKIPSTSVALVLLLSLFVGSHALKVNIYRDLNFKGLIYEHITNDEGTPCYDLEPYARGEAGSIKTDACLLIYESTGCSGNSYKLSRDMTDELAHLARKVSSFHVCNANYGGRQIRVDMFNGNTVLGEYRDICGCQDLPTQVSSTLNRLKNYGNCITVYSTETCSGSTREIQGGQNDVSENLASLGFRVRSVSGCGSRRACYQLDARIYKFRILSDNTKTTKASILQDAEPVELATKTTFHNNGSATVTQEYEARKTIRESTTITRSKTITAMNSHTVEVGSSVEVEAGVGAWFASVSTKVTASLNYAYNREDTTENSESEEITHEVESEFAVRQTIEIPPCAQYEVSSMVSVTKNMPIKYELYTKVTGMSSGERMTAEQVSQQVDDELVFVEYLDEYTAAFKSVESLVANVGVNTFISGEGEDIIGCSMREPVGKYEL